MSHKPGGGDPLVTLRRLPLHWYVFAAVFLVRLLALARLSASPALIPTGGDAAFYNEWAQRIAGGHLSEGSAFYALPLYAYWLAAIYEVIGYAPFVALFVQCVVDAGTALLLCRIATNVAVDGAMSREWPHEGRATAIFGAACGLAWGFYVPAAVYAVSLMPSSLAVFVFWWVVWKLLCFPDPPTLWGWLAVAAAIGVAAMAVATILFLVPLLFAALLWRWKPRPPARYRLKAGAVVLGGVLAGTSPCWLHNALVAHDPVFLSAHSGVNFWIGNNPDASGYPTFPGLRAAQATMMQDSIELAEKEAGRSLRRSEVSRFWSARAKEFIRKHPVAWLRLLGTKVSNFWNAFQYDDLGVIRRLRSEGIVLPGFGFGLISGLGIPGLCLSLRRFTAARWVAAALLLQMAALLPVFLTERYRLAAAPALILFAALGLVILWQSCAAARLRSIGCYTAIAALALWWVSRPPARPAVWALQFYNAGALALATGDPVAAQAEFERALAYAPGNAEVQFALGNVDLQQGHRPRARQQYLQALASDPRHKGALNNLGVLALEDQDAAAAAQYFRRALQEEPANAKSHYLLAKAFLAMGEREAARHEVERALALVPGQAEFRALREELQ